MLAVALRRSDVILAKNRRIASEDMTFVAGQSGNPAGRKPGTRNRRTVLIQAMLEDEGEAVARRVIEAALGGDMIAARLVLERIVPPRRERAVAFGLPPLRSAADMGAAMAAIAEAAAAGEIMLGEAAEFAKLLETFSRVLETTDFERRLRLLEAQNATRP